MSQLKPEIDYRTIKFIIGLIAISLAFVTNFLAGGDLPSISDSYHLGGWPRSIFVGSMFVIAAYLVAYNGKSKWEYGFSKIAALSALGIAMFPCKCDHYAEIINGVHASSAALMFGILSCFCIIFLRRALAKGHYEAKLRALVYASCWLVIVGSIAIIGIDGFLHGAIKEHISRIVFYGERAGLIAFGISWLTASHVFPVINSEKERYKIL